MVGKERESSTVVVLDGEAFVLVAELYCLYQVVCSSTQVEGRVCLPFNSLDGGVDGLEGSCDASVIAIVARVEVHEKVGFCHFGEHEEDKQLEGQKEGQGGRGEGSRKLRTH